MVNLEVRTGPQLRRIAKELKRVGASGEIRKALSRNIRVAAKPLVPAVRASIDAIPSKSEEPKLRPAMKRATTLTVKTTTKNAGVSIGVKGIKMPSGMGRIPSYMEGKRVPWRHPVYGNKENWVEQQAHPYFYRVTEKFGPIARETINKTMDEISKEVL